MLNTLVVLWEFGIQWLCITISDFIKYRYLDFSGNRQTVGSVIRHGYSRDIGKICFNLYDMAIQLANIQAVPTVVRSLTTAKPG